MSDSPQQTPVVKVKICGVTSIDDARTAVAAGAAAVGLNFYPRSLRYVTPELAATIVAALPPWTWRVGVFVDAAREEVRAIAEACGLDTLQFHGDESPAYCRGWSWRTIKAIRVKDSTTMQNAAAYPVDFILADAYVEGLVGGTGRVIPAGWLEGIDRNRLVLAGGLTPENVADLVRRIRPVGVDVASGVESAPGRKDPERVRRFIINAQTA